MASRIARPARAARSASLSCASGQPKYAITPSPRYLRDVPAEARDRLRRRAMIPGDGLAPFLGIELRGDRGRADQVAEQHRQMPPLAATVVRSATGRSGAASRTALRIARRIWLRLVSGSRTFATIGKRSAFAAEVRSLEIFR